MLKKLVLTMVLVLLLFSMFIQPSETLTVELAGSTKTKSFINPVQPVGMVAAELTAVPSATGYLGFSFDSFVANATASSPTCTVRATQSLSADANKTLQADPNPTTPLSKIYVLDYDPYVVDAFNDSTVFKTSGTLNITLTSHYILDETWVKQIVFTFYGNTSIYPDTLAEWYIYNFTSGAWLSLGTLNSTTRTSLSVTLASGLPSLIDEARNNALMVKYNYTDTTNTDFLLHIDYVEVNVTYEFSLQVSSWEVEQVNSTVELSKPEGTYMVNFWENFTVQAPSGIVNHNFTLYIYPANHSFLLNHTLYVNGTKTSITVTNGEVKVNVVNLVANSTALNFNTKIEVKFLNRVLKGQFWCRDLPIRYNERQRTFNLTLTANASAYYYENLTMLTHIPYTDKINATSALGRPLLFVEGSPTKIVINYLQSGEKETIKLRYQTTTKLRVKVVSSYTGEPVKGAKVTVDVGFEKRVKVTGKNGIVEFKTLIGNLSYTVTVEKGRETFETIVDVEWDRTTELTASLATLVLPWWTPYLLLIILIIVVLFLMWRKKVIRVPGISMPHISLPKIPVRKIKKIKVRVRVSKRTLAIIFSTLFFTAMYVSYTWRVGAFSTIPYTGEAILKISAVPVHGIFTPPEEYLKPVRIIVVNPLSNMTLEDFYIATETNPYVYVPVPKHPGYIYVAMISPSENYYLYEPLSSEHVFMKVDNITFYKIEIPAPPLFQKYSEENPLTVTGELVKAGNISLLDPGNITFTTTIFTSNLIFKLEHWTALYNATVKISLNVSGIVLSSAKLNGTTLQTYHDDADKDGVYDAGENLYVFLGNQSFLINKENIDATYILSLTFSNATISSGQIIKATIEIYHYKFNPLRPFIYKDMARTVLATAEAHYTKT